MYRSCYIHITTFESISNIQQAHLSLLTRNDWEIIRITFNIKTRIFNFKRAYHVCWHRWTFSCRHALTSLETTVMRWRPVNLNTWAQYLERFSHVLPEFVLVCVHATWHWYCCPLRSICWLEFKVWTTELHELYFLNHFNLLIL